MDVALHEVRYPKDTPFGVHTASYIGLPSHPTRAGRASSGMPYNEEDAEDALHSVSLVDCARLGAATRSFARRSTPQVQSQVTIDAPFELHDDQVSCHVDAFDRATVSKYEGTRKSQGYRSRCRKAAPTDKTRARPWCDRRGRTSGARRDKVARNWAGFARHRERTARTKLELGNPF